MRCAGVQADTAECRATVQTLVSANAVSLATSWNEEHSRRHRAETVGSSTEYLDGYEDAKNSTKRVVRDDGVV
jgi:hypothetical protein